MSKLSNDDLEWLLAISRAATKGEWKIATAAQSAASAGLYHVICSTAPTDADAVFIATASPAKITALVQQLQEAQRAAQMNAEFVEAAKLLARSAYTRGDYQHGSPIYHAIHTVNPTIAKGQQP